MGARAIGMMFLNVLLVLVIMYVIKMVAVKTNITALDKILPAYNW